MDNFQAQAQPTNTANDLCASPNPLLYLIHDTEEVLWFWPWSWLCNQCVTSPMAWDTIYICVYFAIIFYNNCEMHMILTYALIYYSYKSEKNYLAATNC